MRQGAETVVLAGSVLVLISGIGVLRFRPALARLHALTKASTLGIVAVLVGCAAIADRPAERAALLLAAVLQLATSPIAATVISRSTFLVERSRTPAEDHEQRAQ